MQLLSLYSQASINMIIVAREKSSIAEINAMQGYYNNLHKISIVWFLMEKMHKMVFPTNKNHVIVPTTT